MTDRWTAGRLELLAEGLGFAEGPVWDAEHGRLLFSDLADDVRRSWSHGAGVETIATGTRRGNGMALTPSGTVLVCEHATSRLVESRPDGTDPKLLAAAWDGRELNSPNDVIRREDGVVFFTDPVYGRRSDSLGVLRPQELDFQGVYRLDPEGELRVIGSLGQPNGLALRADGALLVADTERDELVCCADPDAPEPRWMPFASLPGAGPDGLELGADGSVLVATRAGIAVIDADGVESGRIDVPGRCTNLCRGPGGTFFITTAHQLYRWWPEQLSVSHDG